jgi:hypothetical protein
VNREKHRPYRKLLGLIIVLIALDFILYQVGRRVSWAFDVSVWGTLGDWAVAIIPAFAVVITVKLCVTDKGRAAERAPSRPLQREVGSARKAIGSWRAGVQRPAE